MIVEDLGVTRPASKAAPRKRRDAQPRPTTVQRWWLSHGLTQPGGKLPLFDAEGQTVSRQTIRSCIRQGWAAPWIVNPVKPDWLVCRLTDGGRSALGAGDSS